MYQKCNDESVDIIKDITKLSNINVEGIFTHFATSDMKNKEYVYKQFKRYKQFIEKLEKKGVMIPIKHISNTGIILDSPELHQDMVRFGSMVYGTYSSYDIKTERVRLKDALSIRAEVAQVKEVEPGEGIGYDLTYITKKRTKIATLPIGYADLAIRKLKNKGYVLIKGIKAPIVGSVCMDQLMVDVTGIDVKMGDVATLIGEDAGNIISIKEVADLLGIDDYELIISIDKRLPKKYIKNGKVIKIIDINVELSNLI
ncbi:alanine racemase [Lutispora saccharofermentans]|uniref:Alanine racemase n=1 Tax=Lutispora saccharofermentans TaxID=3024236 RepID=A0ABT1NBU9_9FIRM|nr:alanine racemase [Lutispora saccharofermentans]MCQ1528732.1 alanine racemase [Lutispora saccharofermentans]